MDYQINLDRVLDDVGQFGRYQKVFYVLLCLPAVFTSYVTLSSVFTQATPEFRCVVPLCDAAEPV